MDEGPLSLEFFHDHGFQRQLCPDCGYYFWALPDEKGNLVHGELCGDSPCVEYSFLGAPTIPKTHTLDSMREAFLGFFEKKGHTRLNRYPVVARWRTDIYLTIASIADFQPHITSGLVPPPANPLTISQPCIRLNDMASVGRSGRHLTTFEMMAHHAFNTPQEKIYWQNETVSLCHELFSADLGMQGSAITYKENPWVGGGNGGQALEVLVGGLELATLVFMDLAEDPKGTIELKGQNFSKQDLAIVDTGYGLERLVWASRGTSTLYEAIYPDIVTFISKQAGVEDLLNDPRSAQIISQNARIAGVLNVDIGTNLNTLRQEVLQRLRQEGLELSMEDLLAIVEPLERVFAVADHARCLAFMFGDGVVPSSAKAGYLARMVARRTMSLLQHLNCPDLLPEVVEAQLKALATFPELQATRDRILHIIDLETKRYDKTLSRGRRAVARHLAENPDEGFGTSQLIHFYESAGLPPEIVAEEAAAQGIEVEVPGDFHAQVAQAHSTETPDTHEETTALELPATKPLYYSHPESQTFESQVIWSQGPKVVLEATGFYPEGGGQPEDLGTLQWETLEPVAVIQVEKNEGVIFHTLEGLAPEVGTRVNGQIDWQRRLSHMRHHTGTHIIGAAARKVLGDHIWQAGASKTIDRARLDLSHYQRLEATELEKIERLANEIVLADEPVERVELPRAEADARYGHALYQGGVPPGASLRVVRIGESTDVQACGGTHASRTGQVGTLKLLSSTRVQEGVERLEFAAGPAAIAAIQERESWLKKAAEEFGVPPDQLPTTAQRFFNEWKERGKVIEKLQGQLAQSKEGGLQKMEIAGVTMHSGHQERTDRRQLQTIARKYTTKDDELVILTATPDTPGQGILLVAASDNIANRVHCGQILQVGAKVGGGRGGGKPTIAQGACPEDRLKEALKVMVKTALEQLN